MLLMTACSATDAPARAEASETPAASTARSAGTAVPDNPKFWIEGGRLRRSDGSSWDQPLEIDHIGDARIGSPFRDEDWLEDWVPVAPGTATDACNLLRSDALPPGVSMLVLDGAVARFDVSAEAAPATVPYQFPFGLRLGQARGEALTALPPEVEVGAHEFQAPGRDYLTWLDPGARLGLRVETADGVVAAIRWGDAAAVMLPGSCA